MILAEASEELVALAEALQIPVSPTYMGKGAIPEDHPLWAGMVGIQTTQRFGNQIFLESDVVLAIGARFGDRHTGELDVYRGERKFIHVDISPEQIGRVFPADLGIVSDAKLALRALARAGGGALGALARGLDRARRASSRTRWSRRTDFDNVPIKPPRVYQELNDYFDPDTIFVTAIGLYQIWSGQFQTTYKPRHYLCCGQAGPLGWEVPACIGVKLAAPETARRRRGRRLLLPVPDGGGRGRGPVPGAVRARDGQQRLHGADPPGREELRHELRRRASPTRGPTATRGSTTSGS